MVPRTSCNSHQRTASHAKQVEQGAPAEAQSTAAHHDCLAPALRSIPHDRPACSLAEAQTDVTAACTAASKSTTAPWGEGAKRRRKRTDVLGGAYCRHNSVGRHLAALNLLWA